MSRKKVIIRGGNLEASDSDVKVEVTFYVTSDRGLELSEVEAMRTQLTRGIAQAIEKLPYSDFGIESIAVHLLDQEDRAQAA